MQDVIRSLAVRFGKFPPQTRKKVIKEWSCDFHGLSESIEGFHLGIFNHVELGLESGGSLYIYVCDVIYVFILKLLNYISNAYINI